LKAEDIITESKAKESPSDSQRFVLRNQMVKCGGDAFLLEEQLNKTLILYRQFKEQHTGLKTKAQQPRPDHAPHAMRLGCSHTACGA
jgi:hypothetical protein